MVNQYYCSLSDGVNPDYFELCYFYLTSVLFMNKMIMDKVLTKHTQPFEVPGHDYFNYLLSNHEQICFIFSKP